MGAICCGFFRSFIRLMAHEFPQNDGVHGVLRFSDFELRTMNDEQQNCFLINGYTDN